MQISKIGMVSQQRFAANNDRKWERDPLSNPYLTPSQRASLERQMNEGRTVNENVKNALSNPYLTPSQRAELENKLYKD